MNDKKTKLDDELLELIKSLDVKDEAVVENAELTLGEKFGEAFKEIGMLFKTPNMRKRTLNIFFSWLVVAMVYYGLSFNTKNGK